MMNKIHKKTIVTQLYTVVNILFISVFIYDS